MATPREPDRQDLLDAAPEGDEPVVPEPERGAPPDDPEVPEADALEQATEVSPGWRTVPPSDDPEVPEADAWEQSQEVPLDDDEPL